MGLTEITAPITNMSKLNDDKIIASWLKNAAPWIDAVQNKKIASRQLITNQAIIETVLSFPGRHILDIGCGEGWLARELIQRGIQVTGIDVVPVLIDAAKKSGDGKFHLIAYEDITADKFPQKYDLAVSNFSLLGKESVDNLFAIIPDLLINNGHFIIQTIHPMSACDKLAYKDGWREGSWQGFGSHFSDPAPWYFRTMETWFKLFDENQFQITQFKEPKFPHNGEVASLIIAGRYIGSHR